MIWLPHGSRRPWRCPTCRRVLWTVADWPYCLTGHPHIGMKLIHADGAPGTSPDIVTNGGEPR